LPAIRQRTIEQRAQDGLDRTQSGAAEGRRQAEAGQREEADETGQMSPQKKDWNERFERAQKRPRHWRIALGVVLTAIKIIQFASPGGLEFLENLNTAGLAGSIFGDVVIFVLAGWLIYSGFKPGKITILKD
jgi:hypothetical protein